jgi:uncharacterized integral membrane protein
MADWLPRLVFAPVNRRVAWRLLLPMLVVTGISGIGAQKQALPSLWKQILPAIEENVHSGSVHNAQPYFAASFVFSVVGILFLVMVLSRAVDIQLAYFAGRASFALSFLWFLCALMSLLPESLMGLHRIFIICAALATLGSQFIRGGTIRYYWREGHFGDLGVQIVFIGTYLTFAWLPLRFALTGR